LQQLFSTNLGGLFMTKEKLKQEIKKLRDKLNQTSQKENLAKKELIKISRKLDQLISQYYD
jgi:ribosomal protein S2